MARRQTVVFGHACRRSGHRGRRRHRHVRGRGRQRPIRPWLAAERRPAGGFDDRPPPAGLGRRGPAHPRQPVGFGQLPPQRHGGGCRRTGLRRQLWLRPARPKEAEASGSHPGGTRRRRPGRCERHAVSQRHRHHPGWQPADRRRILGRPAVRLRPRRGRQPDQPAGLGNARRRWGPRRHLPGRSRRHLGGLALHQRMPAPNRGRQGDPSGVHGPRRLRLHAGRHDTAHPHLR